MCTFFGEFLVEVSRSGLLVSIACDDNLLLGVGFEPFGDVVYIDFFGGGDDCRADFEAYGGQ